MLQWFGDKSTQIIYNDLVDEKFVSIIFNLKTKDKIILPLAIYALSSDSKFALCIDNERHYKLGEVIVMMVFTIKKKKK